MMRLCIALGIILSGWLHGAELRIDFSEALNGQAPPGFRSSLSGTGKPSEWKIVLDEPPTNLPRVSENAPLVKLPVIAQLSTDPTDERFPLLVYEEGEFNDFRMTTWIKMVAGKTEQMAGVAFRMRDEKNYYYVRASALGNNVRFFSVINGERQRPFGNDITIETGKWYKLTIECNGNQISTFLNDNPIIPTLTDNSHKSGRIALWTKSDSVSHFSNIKIDYQPKVIFAQRLVQDIRELYPRVVDLDIYAQKPGDTKTTLIAGLDPDTLGKEATETELDVIKKSTLYYGRSKKTVRIVLPFHDNNGETMAAVAIRMKRFRGQTEKNAISRALPIMKAFEQRALRLEELVQ